MKRINTLIIGLLITLLAFPFASLSVFATVTVTSEGAVVYEVEGEVLGQSNRKNASAVNQQAQESDEDDSPVGGPGNSANARGKTNNTVKIMVKDNIPPGQAKKLQVEAENDHVNITVEGEDGTEYEYESETTDELEIEESEVKKKVKIRSKNNAAYVIQNKLAAKTNFPLQVNLETNELIVTTPKGSKVVTVLPDKAVENMLAANVLDQLGGKGGLMWLAAQEAAKDATSSGDLDDDDDATDSGDLGDDGDATDSGDLGDDGDATDSGDLGDDGDATDSAEPSPEPEPKTETVDEVIELVTDNEGNIVYEIEGVKYKKFLGVRKITLNRTAVVSAETGELLELRQDFFTQLKDILSV